MADEEKAPTEEELREQIRRLKVADVLVTCIFQISSLGYHKLSEEARDLDQARLAIEALRALIPIAGPAVSEEVKRDLDLMVANMQLAYAEAAKGS